MLNREQRQNTLCQEALARLVQALRDASADLSVRVIVLRGAGDRVFCPGYDLGQLPSTAQDWVTRVANGEIVSREADVMMLATEAIANHRCPVIAMIHGPALGSGLDLAVSCDMRLVDDRASFGVAAVKRAVMYHPQGIRRLVDLVGLGAAKEILLSGNAVDAHRAREIGLVNHVYPAQDLENATYALAEQMAANAPMVMSGSKLVFSRLMRERGACLEDDDDIGRLMADCFASRDFQEGMRAFQEKREPLYEGR